MFDEVRVVGELAGVVDRLADLPRAAGDDTTRIDVIGWLEKLKAAAAAAQLRVIADFADSQVRANRARGLPADRAGRGVAEQVGLARKVSPATAARQVGQARALRDELPATLQLLTRGQVSEWVASLVVTETSHLHPHDRRHVDDQLAPRLGTLSPRRAAATARALAIAADPAAAVARAAHARTERYVTTRPAPDTMAYLTALLPCEQAVAAHAALLRHAATLTAHGDPRSRAQLMADTLVDRVTGQTPTHAIPAEIGLVMTDTALLTDDPTPAQLTGYGPIPAPLARRIAAGGPGATTDPTGLTGLTGLAGLAGLADPTGLAGLSGDRPRPGPASPGELARARTWIRRLYTDPVTGIITHADPRRRRFDTTLARLLAYRDQTCRDPYCDAPIRHTDHITPHAAGGLTTPDNGRGVCERGNHTRQMPGWVVRVVDAATHQVETTTPTGHRYHSTPPPAPGWTRAQQDRASPTGPPGPTRPPDGQPATPAGVAGAPDTTVNRSPAGSRSTTTMIGDRPTPCCGAPSPASSWPAPSTSRSTPGC